MDKTTGFEASLEGEQKWPPSTVNPKLFSLDKKILERFVEQNICTADEADNFLKENGGKILPPLEP